MIFHILTTLNTAFAIDFWHSEVLPFFLSVDSMRIRSPLNCSYKYILFWRGACSLKSSTMYLRDCLLFYLTVRIKILSPFSLFKTFSSKVGILFHTFSIIVFFHKPRNCRLIHRKYSFTLCSHRIYKFITCLNFQSSSDISCCLPSIDIMLSLVS